MERQTTDNQDQIRDAIATRQRSRSSSSSGPRGAAHVAKWSRSSMISPRSTRKRWKRFASMRTNTPPDGGTQDLHDPDCSHRSNGEERSRRSGVQSRTGTGGDVRRRTRGGTVSGLSNRARFIRMGIAVGIVLMAQEFTVQWPFFLLRASLSSVQFTIDARCGKRSSAHFAHRRRSGRRSEQRRWKRLPLHARHDILYI